MIADYATELLSKYRRRGCIIDTNLLLLYFVGSYDPAWIQKFKRTHTYTVEDYNLLMRLLAYLDVIVTTPNILTEVSNLCKQLPNSIMESVFREFSKQVRLLHEESHPSQLACAEPYFQRFGLTDAVIAHISTRPYLVLTADFALFGLLQKLGIDAINFNHIRPLGSSGA